MLHKAITLLTLSSAAFAAVIPRDLDHVEVPVLSDILHIGNDDGKNISALNNNSILNTFDHSERRKRNIGGDDGDISHIGVPVLSDILHIGNNDVKNVSAGNNNDILNTVSSSQKRDTSDDGDLSHIVVPVLSDILHIGNDDVKNVSILNNNNILNTVASSSRNTQKRGLFDSDDEGTTYNDEDGDGDLSHIGVSVLSDILHIGNNDVKNVSALDNNDILNTVGGAAPLGKRNPDYLADGEDSDGDLSHIGVSVLSDILHIGNDDVKNVSVLNNNNILNTVGLSGAKRGLFDGGDDFTGGDSDGDLSHIGVSVLSDILHIGNDDVKNASVLDNNDILNTVSSSSKRQLGDFVEGGDSDGDLSHIGVSVLSDILHIGNNDIKNVSLLNNNSILNTVSNSQNAARGLGDFTEGGEGDGDLSHIGVSVLSDILHIGNDDIKNISVLNNNSILNTVSSANKRQLTGAINSPLNVLPADVPTEDTCTFVEAGALSGLTGGGAGATTGFTNACLCIANIEAYLITNPAAAAVAVTIGLEAAEAALQQIVANDPTRVTCTFPAFSVPTCTNNDPCSYVCIPGYSLQGDECVRASAPPSNCGNGYSLDGQDCTCASPNGIYGGQCQTPSYNPSA